MQRTAPTQRMVWLSELTAIRGPLIAGGHAQLLAELEDASRARLQRDSQAAAFKCDPHPELDAQLARLRRRGWRA